MYSGIAEFSLPLLKSLIVLLVILGVNYKLALANSIAND